MPKPLDDELIDSLNGVQSEVPQSEIKTNEKSHYHCQQTCSGACVYTFSFGCGSCYDHSAGVPLSELGFCPRGNNYCKHCYLNPV